MENARYRIKGTVLVTVKGMDGSTQTLPVVRYMSITNGDRNWVVTPERATSYNNLGQVGSLAFRLRVSHPHVLDVVIEEYGDDARS